MIEESEDMPSRREELDSITLQKNVPMRNANVEASYRVLLQMNDFRRRGVLCDIGLLCDDENRIEAHKIVLSSVSPYFATMFQTNMWEKHQKDVYIKGVDSTSMEALVEYAYTADITVTIDNIFHLLSAAHMLCFEEVEKTCVEFLCNNLNFENCLDICDIAESLNCRELQNLTTLYVTENFRRLVKYAGFLHLSPKQLHAVLEKDKINVSSESEVYEAVMRWVKFDLANRKYHLTTLLEQVRFGLMSRKYVVDRVLRDSVIMANEDSRKFILKVVDMYLLPERTFPSTSINSITCSPRKAFNRTLFVLGGEGKSLFIMHSITL